MFDIFFNGLLVGTSVYALYVIQPYENPCICTVGALNLCHGLLGLYGNIIEGTSNNQVSEEPTTSHLSIARKLHCLSRSCVDIVTVPLLNIDFYLLSTQSSPLALGHGLFIVPLIFDFSYKLFSADGVNNATETLKDLTALGNMVSLVFLAVNENYLPYGLMALAALSARYGSSSIQTVLRGTGANIQLAGYSLLIGLIPWATSK